VSIQELARRLDDLKDVRRAARRDGHFERVHNRRVELEDLLEPLGLGLAWQDSDECYMIYSFKSIKE